MSNILTNNINPRSGNKITIGGVNDTVSIAGTITYEDVTSVDSIGIITGRSGLHVIGAASSVGIGTDEPSYKLDIRVTGAESGMRVYNPDSSALASGMLRLGNDTNANSAFLQLNSSNNTTAVGGPDSLVLGHGLQKQVHLASGGVSRLTVDVGGNIGIGTTDPNDVLNVKSTGLGDVTGITINAAPSGNTAGILRIKSASGIQHAEFAGYTNNCIISTDEVEGQIILRTGIGTERMRIDSSGRVTKPSQPSFFSRPPAGYNLSLGENIIGGTWTNLHNIGSHFSNGTFTVPVAGVYQFNWNVFLQSELARADAYITVNGSQIMRTEINGYSTTAGNKTASVAGCYYLNASDAVTFGCYSSGTNIYTTNAPWSYASGFLVG